MSKQISLTTMTALVLSACCSTLSQGATPLDAVQTSAPVPVGVLSAGETVARVSPELPVSAVVALPPPSGEGDKVVKPAAVNPIDVKPVTPKPVTPKPVVTNVKPPLGIKKSTVRAPKKIAASPRPVPKRVRSTNEAPLFNRPYQMYGVQYTPLPSAQGFHQRGEATWYSKTHQGQPTVNGEIYDVYGMTAAHPTLPIPSYARVTNLSNRKSVVVRINDRGPFHFNKKIIDLSYSAANKIGMVSSDNRQVEVVGLASDTPAPAKNSAPIVFNFTPTRPAESIKKVPLPAKLVSPVVAVMAKKRVEKQPVSSLKSTIYVQLGAFKTIAAAQAFMQKMRTTLGDTSYPLTVALQDKLHRVRLGAYPNLEEARRAATALTTTLGFKPIVKQSN